MPTLNDFYTQVQQVNTNLGTLDNDVKTLHADLGAVAAELSTINSTLSNGFAHLIALETYSAHALAHLSKQADTMICALERISKNTCALVDLADIEVDLTRSIKNSDATLVQLYETTNPASALTVSKDVELRKAIEDCCPPQPRQSICDYEACPALPPLGDPPKEGVQVTSGPRRRSGRG